MTCSLLNGQQLKEPHAPARKSRSKKELAVNKIIITNVFIDIYIFK